MPQFTVSTTGVNVAEKNPLRISLSFRHNGTANEISVQQCQAAAIKTTTSEFTIGAKGAVSLTLRDDGREAVQNAWAAIANTGSQTLIVFEGMAKTEEQVLAILGMRGVS